MKQFRNMLYPYVVWLFIMVLVPMLMILLYAFTTAGNEVTTFRFTLDNFSRFLTDTVFLDVHPDVLFNRLRVGTQQRPILRGKTDEELRIFIVEALEKRSPFYSQAHYRFDVGRLESHRQIEESVQRLRTLLCL